MHQRTTLSLRRFTGFSVAAALLSLPLAAQKPLDPQQPVNPTTSPTSTTDIGNTTVTGSTTTSTDAQGHPQASASVSFGKKKKVNKDDRVVQSKDTRRENRKEAKLTPLAGQDANLPDKALYDKALAQTKKGHFDVARLDLQTLLNTYPDSQYQMRAKLAIADSWYREGGSAALTQAEQEYNDFITFFPQVPEAAEAQMRVGDIYFKQMDVPDRDYTKGLKAEEAYRLMLKQYPDSTLVPDARQKLREVQELLATREADIAAFYGTHGNYAASIARYQTVVDTYPLFSHMDDVLIGIGDAYAAQARAARTQPVCSKTLPAGTPCLPEGAKAQIISSYDQLAAANYRKVVLEHSAAPHVEDAKERLETMGLPLPQPTAEQMAASDQLEGSRAQYTISKRLEVLLLHKPDMVFAAREGDPPLEDAVATVAPAVSQQVKDIYVAALNPNAVKAKPVSAAPVNDSSGSTETPIVAKPAGPLALQDVAGPGEGGSGATTAPLTEAAPTGTASGRGNSVGVEILTPGVSGSAPASTEAVPNSGLSAVGPKNTSALPPIEKAADAPDQVNEVAGKSLPAAQTKDPNNKKNPKPALDKGDESSSKKKPKKGVDKINPF